MLSLNHFAQGSDSSFASIPLLKWNFLGEAAFVVDFGQKCF